MDNPLLRAENLRLSLPIIAAIAVFSVYDSILIASYFFFAFIYAIKLALNKNSMNEQTLETWRKCKKNDRKIRNIVEFYLFIGTPIGLTIGAMPIIHENIHKISFVNIYDYAILTLFSTIFIGIIMTSFILLLALIGPVRRVGSHLRS